MKELRDTIRIGGIKPVNLNTFKFNGSEGGFGDLLFKNMDQSTISHQKAPLSQNHDYQVGASEKTFQKKSHEITENKINRETRTPKKDFDESVEEAASASSQEMNATKDAEQSISTDELKQMVKEAVQSLVKKEQSITPEALIAQLGEENNIDVSQFNLDSLMNAIQEKWPSLKFDQLLNSEMSAEDLMNDLEQIIANLSAVIEGQIAKASDKQGNLLSEEETELRLKMVNLNDTDLNFSLLDQKSNQGKNNPLLMDSDNVDPKFVQNETKKDPTLFFQQVLKSGEEDPSFKMNQEIDLGKLDFNLNKMQSGQQLVNQNHSTGLLTPLNTQLQNRISAAQAVIDAKPGTVQFREGFSERVVFLLKNDLHAASIKLNPPELGPLEINIKINPNRQADLLINTQHAMVKDSVEQALPRLRDMLSDSGIQLNNVNVSDQSHKQQAQGNNSDSKDPQSSQQNAFGELFDTEDHLSEFIVQARRSDGLIDYYA